MRKDHTAYHEAGHAVIALSLGFGVRKATIIEAEDSYGQVKQYVTTIERRIEYDHSPIVVDRIEKLIHILYAGGIAERKFAPRCKWRPGARGDHDKVADLFVYICGPDDKAQLYYSKLLWSRTELAVDFHWREIEAVARALLAEMTLTGKQVRAIMDDVLYGDIEPPELLTKHERRRP